MERLIISIPLKRGTDDSFTPLTRNSSSGVLPSNLLRASASNEIKKAKYDCSVSLMTLATNGMVLPTTQQQFISTINFDNSAQFLGQPLTSTNVGSIMPVTTQAYAIEGSGTSQISRVVHLRNIPSDMTDLELLQFCMPFGKLVNYLLLNVKNQAFVEYEDEQSAQNLIAVSTACPAVIREKYHIFTNYFF
ncbi:unnamed protein product [Thelazia callipaeda]|uniref:RRM domain-containing protein n=1 Tax=Thelazia callipaeda TaxID=103827 RepID=A0A0N5D512_THECL|nr:unnamed protein product [Thelazia callipaeda]